MSSDAAAEETPAVLRGHARDDPEQEDAERRRLDDAARHDRARGQSDGNTVAARREVDATGLTAHRDADRVDRRAREGRGLRGAEGERSERPHEQLPGPGLGRERQQVDPASDGQQGPVRTGERGPGDGPGKPRGVVQRRDDQYQADDPEPSGVLQPSGASRAARLSGGRSRNPS